VQDRACSFHRTGPSTFHLSSSSPRVSADQFPPFFFFFVLPYGSSGDFIFNRRSHGGNARSLSARSSNALSYLSRSGMKRGVGSAKKSRNGRFRITCSRQVAPEMRETWKYRCSIELANTSFPALLPSITLRRFVRKIF